MKLKPGFDDEFQPKGQRWLGGMRSIGWVISIAVVCGIAFSVTAGTGKYKRSARSAFQGSQRTVPIPQVRAPVAQSRDPFVVVAAAEIDTEMVVAAPAGIDEAMVFNPDRRAGQAARAPVLLTPLNRVPGGRPGQVPGNAIPPRSPTPSTPP